MNCEQIQGLLPEFVDHQLKGPQMIEIEHHVRVCEDCGGLQAVYRQNLQLLGSFPEVAPPPGLVERIIERTGRPAGVREWLERYLRVPIPVLVPAAVALLFVLLVPPFLKMDTVPSRTANKYVHQTWSYTLRLYGRAEGIGQQIADLKNIFTLILDRRAERIQDQLRNQKKDEQQSSRGAVTCEGSQLQGVDEHVLRLSSDI